MSRVTPDLAGSKVGHMTVLRRLEERSRQGWVMWECRCDCGNLCRRSTSQLNQGRITSCGCRNHRGNVTHGKAHTRTYRIWHGMKARCLYPSQPAYRLYGGRGIRVCERWLSFESFLADMGEAPGGTSIDRIDPDGDYEPGNCRWATDMEQGANRRANVIATFDGRTQCASAWAREWGCSRQWALWCIRRGRPAMTPRPVAQEAGRRGSAMRAMIASGDIEGILAASGPAGPF